MLCSFRKYEERSAGINYSGSTHIICLEFEAWSEDWETFYKTLKPQVSKAFSESFACAPVYFLHRFSFSY